MSEFIDISTSKVRKDHISAIGPVDYTVQGGSRDRTKTYFFDVYLLGGQEIRVPGATEKNAKSQRDVLLYHLQPPNA